MGSDVSSGCNNTEIVDNLISAEYIKSSAVEKVFRAVDRGNFYLPDQRLSAYKDMAWKYDTFHLSSPSIYAEVLEALQLKEGCSFLNMGSGIGYLSTMAGLIIGSKGINHGVEFFAENVEYARKKVDEFILTNPNFDKFDFCVPLMVKGNFLLINEYMDDAFKNKQTKSSRSNSVQTDADYMVEMLDASFYTDTNEEENDEIDIDSNSTNSGNIYWSMNNNNIINSSNAFSSMESQNSQISMGQNLDISYDFLNVGSHVEVETASEMLKNKNRICNGLKMEDFNLNENLSTDRYKLMRYDKVYVGCAVPLQYIDYIKQFVKINGFIVLPLNDFLVLLKRVSEDEWTKKKLFQVNFGNLIEPDKDEYEQQRINLPKIKVGRLQELCRFMIRSKIRQKLIQQKYVKMENIGKIFSQAEFVDYTVDKIHYLANRILNEDCYADVESKDDSFFNHSKTSNTENLVPKDVNDEDIENLELNSGTKMTQSNANINKSINQSNANNSAIIQELNSNFDQSDNSFSSNGQLNSSNSVKRCDLTTFESLERASVSASKRQRMEDREHVINPSPKPSWDYNLNHILPDYDYSDNFKYSYHDDNASSLIKDSKDEQLDLNDIGSCVEVKFDNKICSNRGDHEYGADVCGNHGDEDVSDNTKDLKGDLDNEEDQFYPCLTDSSEDMSDVNGSEDNSMDYDSNSIEDHDFFYSSFSDHSMADDDDLQFVDDEELSKHIKPDSPFIEEAILFAQQFNKNIDALPLPTSVLTFLKYNRVFDD